MRDAEIADIGEVQLLHFGPGRRVIAIDLLETYVGRRTGKRIYGGHIERGKIETIVPPSSWPISGASPH